MEVCREDLLKQSECDVDSTTEDSPVKKPKTGMLKSLIQSPKKELRLWLLNREQESNAINQ